MVSKTNASLREERIALAKKQFRFSAFIVGFVWLFMLVTIIFAREVPLQAKMVFIPMLLVVGVLGFFIAKWQYKLLFTNFANWLGKREVKDAVAYEKKHNFWFFVQKLHFGFSIFIGLLMIGIIVLVLLIKIVYKV